MGPAQQPKAIENPGFGGRIKSVLGSGYQDRSAPEITVYLVGLLLLAVASASIAHSSLDVGLKVLVSVLALAIIATVSTLIMVKIRFKA
jgi:hypothetical protein